MNQEEYIFKYLRNLIAWDLGDVSLKRDPDYGTSALFQNIHMTP